MIEENHPTKRYGKTVVVDQPVPLAQRPRAITWTRIVALMVIIVLLTGLTYLGVSSSPETVSVPLGAHAGQLTMHPCTYSTENGGYRADCGTLVVPEDRAYPRSRLIALPVTRILARSSHPLAPIFHLNGGPGTTNMTFPQANRLAAQHDVVMVGYRGVDGSSVLNCPEVTAALENSGDYLAKASLSAYSQAFASCAQRLERSGVDLAGYTLAEQADDIDAARVALGYKRIDLLSESAETRLAMIYAWRYPNSVDRSAMIGVNPPGNFLYSGAEIDQGIERYSALCAKQPACRARTGNLAASMQHTAADMPSRWYFLPIKPGNVRVATFLGLISGATAADSQLSGPVTLNSWISAAQGDPSGLWLLSLFSDLTLPQSFTWGEFASIGMADAQPAERYFSSGAGGGSIIGNPFTEFLWGAGGLVHAWPANPGENQYTSVQNSNVPTLLIGGTLDFATPAQNATKELLPHLPNGHQVILSGLGHVDDFWYYEPSASTQLLTTFYDTGQVDTSRYTQHVVSFASVGNSQAAIAKDILGAMIGFAALAALWLLWVARRVRKHGAAGPKTSFATRTIVPLVLGLGGWLGAALVVLTLWPAVSLYSELLGILGPSVPIALGLYLAWTHRDWDRATKSLGLLAATAGALLGGWFGFTATSGLSAVVITTIGAAAAGNLALIAASLFRERSARAAMATTPPQPTVARSTSDRVEGLDHDLVVVGRVEHGAP
ncbi:MAG TPA: alpha/beta fold hydrolase [Acidimicrobiales bacterium]|nr:alpha/beta fold hydrolase [Acidimicrobiales bacterium]